MYESKYKHRHDDLYAELFPRKVYRIRPIPVAEPTVAERLAMRAQELGQIGIQQVAQSAQLQAAGQLSFGQAQNANPWAGDWLK